MFSRSSSRIAHPSDSSSSHAAGTPSPSRSPSLSFPLRRKFHLSFLRFRISSFLRLLRRMRISCRHALHALILLPKTTKKRTPPCTARVSMSFSTHCTRSACAPDAIADCIEFIKKSSSSFSSSSSPSQPSSPSLSSPFYPPLSSLLLSPSSQHSHHNPSPSSHLHHDNSCSSQLYESSLSSSPLSHNNISPCHYSNLS